MRRLTMSLTALVAATLLAACTTQDSAAPASPTPVTPATASAEPSPSASATAAPSPSATPTPSPSGDPVRVPATITGMHVAGVQDGDWPDGNVPFGSLRLWDAGTAWSQVESTRGRYNWALLDRAVRNAEVHGVKDILLVLGSTPSWNATRVNAADYPVPGAASPPKDIKAWDAFVRATVQRYKGRITSYQVWNEASLAMFWNGSPELMAELTKRAYDIIRSVDPKARVVSASTTVRLGGAFAKFFPRYLAALKKDDWPIDVFSAHLYPPSRGSTDTRATYITAVTDALAAAGAPDLPLWDTELNYGLAGPGPANPRRTIQGGRARDWVVQTELDSLALGIARTYWYIWTPQPYPLLGMQLTNDSGAVAGLRVINQWAVGGTTRGCVDDGSVTWCSVEKKGVPSIIAWADDRQGTFTVPEGFTEVCRTTNACTPISGPLILNETPVRILP